MQNTLKKLFKFFKIWIITLIKKYLNLIFVFIIICPPSNFHPIHCPPPLLVNCHKSSSWSYSSYAHWTNTSIYCILWIYNIAYYSMRYLYARAFFTFCKSLLHSRKLKDESYLQLLNYNGLRIYQYNEDDFRFQLWFLPSFPAAWTHINMETKSCCQ